MKQHKRKLALLAAAILACSAAGCAGTQDQSSAQSQSQLWVVDNSVDVQQDYVMENPSAIGDLTTPVRVISKEEQAASQRAEQPDEVRAIWLSYLDLKPMLLNSDDTFDRADPQFQVGIDGVFYQNGDIHAFQCVGQLLHGEGVGDGAGTDPEDVICFIRAFWRTSRTWWRMKLVVCIRSSTSSEIM